MYGAEAPSISKHLEQERNLAITLVRLLLMSKTSAILKMAFFQKVRFVFQISKSKKKIFQKNYPELEI